MPYEYFVRTTFDLRGDFYDYIPTYQETVENLVNSFPGWKNVKEIFDGGCGYGASTLVIGSALPKSQIWAVSTG